MAEGYFRDGTVHVELGQHTFASPTAYRFNIPLEPPDVPARIHDAGGGILEVGYTGQRLRTNMGDAERYIYELFLSLATTDAGDLVTVDNRGNPMIWPQSVCVGATGEVRALKFADMSLAFLTAEKTSKVAEFGYGVPAAPGAYGGTSTQQNYQAGGVALGIGGEMRIEMMRDWPLREIPRARGARTTEPHRGGHVRLIVTAHQVSAARNLADDLSDLARAIGPRPIDLTANGNTYKDVILESLRPSHTDLRATSFEAEFVQEI